ncbi:anhydro-N-acetylmuramic acid kinase [Micavibrio aeruginosavorus]|uniref:Anhydro-N-acetylmuramic acid kinase n=1 Tax=Micavibrio aeruginosavorus EPB TaxID=349215 RepID=M4VHV4_9BACT|nr:anhydro-N-acetylmuramic acid kinase [Micavibrio aeruginosavorus]AGH98788.1 Anhydro-N-acetylmuramic acid kinase [Micavibrio aeruginosavorus EPB]
MQKPREYTVIGLMSGTSLDGIDAALIRTDGADSLTHLGFITIPYADSVRDALRACLGRRVDNDGTVARAEALMTMAHADAVRALLAQTGVDAADVDLIGFHGQTIMHDAPGGFTWQIGDGDLLARETGIDVINDFRTNDVKHGGQGAPLIPLYHRAMAASSGLDLPVAILNIGGVANVTWIGADGRLSAFDTGPGNAIINDWTRQQTGAEFDQDGQLAKSGTFHNGLVRGWLGHQYFRVAPPKSLDRDAWHIIGDLVGMSAADGAATLTRFTVESIAAARDHLPEAPKAWYVAGGGRLNPVIMDGLRDVLGVPVHSIDALGWNGDAVEAEGFAWLAVRSLLGQPLSVPETTGCKIAVSGGRLHPAPGKTMRVG